MLPLRTVDAFYTAGDGSLLKTDTLWKPGNVGSDFYLHMENAL